jgi:hypothetical protein
MFAVKTFYLCIQTYLTIMKRFILSAILAIAAIASANAQVAPGMKYKDIKDVYNPKSYVALSTDPYSRVWSGVASWLVPGLGQVVCGETGRGLAFFGADIALSVVGRIGGEKFKNNVNLDKDGNFVSYVDESAAKSGAFIMVGALTGLVVVEIWSIVDAVKVAKVKNMYFQDLNGRRAAIDLGFEPYFTLAPSSSAVTGNAFQPVAGMSMRLSF